ncbi:unnamed protein product [Rotaria sp. Silwood1]|nr:unnamed protein product [Rotaria sp. Silwood1]CAF1615961.1 unnamed protein product [Rotaria sp. Silwood1]
MFYMIQQQLKLFLLIIFYCFNIISGGPDQNRLLNYLLADNRYRPIARPVQNDSDTLPVTINLALQQIIDYDGKNEAIIISGWITIMWYDYSLRWKPEEFGNIQTLRIPRVNLTAENSRGQLDAYVQNAEWQLEGSCINIIVFRFIAPCFLISCMTPLGFLLSPDSGEKLTLRELEFDHKKFILIHLKSSEITTLLSVIMFSLVLSEILPSSSTAIPIITIYFICVMFMTAVSVVASVFILSLHNRNSSNHTMPLWIRKYICDYLAWLLLMKRPDHDLSWHAISRRWTSSKEESDNIHESIGIHQSKIPSESLFNNKFDLLSSNVINVHKEPLVFLEKQHSDSILESAVPPATKTHDYGYHQNTSNELYICDMDTTCSELRVIISQLAILINYSRKKEKDENESQDWQFAAMVIDRLCLLLFSIIMFLFTAFTLLHV